MILGLLRLLLLTLTLSGASSVLAAPQPVNLVRLYLHGLNSNATTWNDAVPANLCPIVRSGVAVTAVSGCYRMQFADRIINGITWPSGDGATLSQLRNEIRRAVRQIRVLVEPQQMILIGHSRGGLAVREYVQSLAETEILPFPVGVVLLGTPNQGTPLARIAVWGRDKGVNPVEVAKELRFAFSPGTLELATDANANGQLQRTPISRRVYILNNGIQRLTQRVTSIGQLSSGGLRLGENVSGDFDALSDVGAQLLAFLTPGSFDDLLHFVLQNIARIDERPVLIDTFSCANERKAQYPLACDGDGVAPRISQHLEDVPGFVAGSTPLHALELANVPHTRETRRINEINALIRQVRSDIASR